MPHGGMNALFRPLIRQGAEAGDLPPGLFRISQRKMAENAFHFQPGQGADRLRLRSVQKAQTVQPGIQLDVHAGGQPRLRRGLGRLFPVLRRAHRQRNALTDQGGQIAFLRRAHHQDAGLRQGLAHAQRLLRRRHRKPPGPCFPQCFRRAPQAQAIGVGLHHAHHFHFRIAQGAGQAVIIQQRVLVHFRPGPGFRTGQLHIHSSPDL